MWRALASLAWWQSLLLAASSFAAEPPATTTDASAPARIFTRSFAPPRQVNYREPRREYVERAAGEWKVFLERDLAEEHADLAEAALRRLEAKLGACGAAAYELLCD